MDAWALIPLAAIVMWGVRGIAQAIVVGRTHRGHAPMAPADDALRAEVEGLRQRVTELEERQDFTERVLTRGSRDMEPGGPHAS